MTWSLADYFWVLLGRLLELFNSTLQDWLGVLWALMGD